MALPRGTLETIATALATLLEPLEERAVPSDVRVLISELGLTFPATLDTQPNFDAAVSVTEQHLKRMRARLPELVAAIEADDPLQMGVKALDLALSAGAVIAGLGDIGQALKTAGAGAGIPAVELDQFADELPARLVEYLVIRRLEALPGVVPALEFIGGVRRSELPAVDPQHPAFVRRELDAAALTDFLTDPLGSLDARYGWGDPGFDGVLLLQTLNGLLARAGVPAILDSGVTPPVLDVVILEVTPETGPPPRGLRVKLAHPFEIDAAPFVQDDWQVRIVGSAQLGLGTELIWRPDDTVVLLPPGAQPVAGDVVVEWTGGAPAGTPYVIVGQPGASRLEARQLIVRAGADLAWDPAAGRASGSFAAVGEVKGGKVVISLSEADGFLGTIMGGARLESEFELGIAFSTRDGIRFTGSSTLEIQVPLHVDLGPVELKALTLSVGIGPEGFPVGVGVDLKAALGPLQAVVEQVGVTALLSLPPDRAGRLGPVDFELGFKPPRGVGLSVDAGVVKGGGFLSIDAERGEYAGALELDFSGIVELKAIGLITTRMPDGSDGFSLLIVITAEFGSGIQLGFGFTLLAVGGVLGLNRSMALQPLIEGVRTNAISSVMFPHDVIANAPQIISDLRTFFPPEDGTFVIGPMAKLGWGTPTLVSLSLGIIIEIPGNVAIVGVLRIALPADELALIVLQVNFVGAIEFDRRRVYFFASIFDSRILFLTIEGEMAVLAAFGDDADFVLSVGGFHPSFSPPPLPVPTPRRIAVDILNEATAKLRVEGYFAVTTNTAQFGARVDARLGFSSCGIEGSLAFDALVQFSPLHFIVTISASVSMKAFGVGLFSVRLRFELQGPAPWRAKGSASLSLLFFDIDVDFDVTWGESRDSALPPIDVMPLLKGEYDKPENWLALLPAANNLLVSLRPLDPVADTLVLHPVGTLRVTQRAVPLDLTISRVGNRKPTDAKRFDLEVSTGGLAKTGDVDESFAPAQYQDFGDAEKLSKPAFQRMHGGIDLSVSGEQLRSGALVKRVIRYEVITIDGAFRKHQRFRGLGRGLFAHLLSGAAIAYSGISQAAKKQLVPFDDKVKVTADRYVVAGQADNAMVATFASEAMASEHLAQQIAQDPMLAGALHVIPAFEAVA